MANATAAVVANITVPPENQTVIDSAVEQLRAAASGIAGTVSMGSVFILFIYLLI